MNQQDKIELSKRVAEKLGINAFRTIVTEKINIVEKSDYTIGCCGNPTRSGECCGNGIAEPYLYQDQEITLEQEQLSLADDNARCFELMVKHKVHVFIAVDHDWVAVTDPKNFCEFVNDYKDHTSPEEATRIAILKCLENME